MSITRAKKLVERNIKLPTLPHVVTRITALASDPNSSAEEVGDAIRQDAPIAAKVLKIANSAYYGVQEEVVSTDRAASILGFDLLKSIVMQASVMAQFEHLSSSGQLDLSSVWRHSILCGHTCSFLARRCKTPLGLEANEFYVVGLLHDVGKIVLLEAIGEEYVEVLAHSQSTGKSLFQCERQMLGFSHTEVGSMLATRWNLPSVVGRGIQFHHGPREAVAEDPAVCLLANVNLLLHRLFDGEDSEDASPEELQHLAAQRRAAAARTFDPSSLALLGVAQGAVEETLDYALEASDTIEF